ncbi:MAG: hypothetical protein Q9217_003614 [Psora testacea]
MGLCTFCSSIPLKLFSTHRDKQCAIKHQPSFPALQASGSAGCELCKLFLHAIQKQMEDGENDRVFGPWSKTGSVTLSSTKFDGQGVDIEYRTAGKFRGRLVPPEWSGPNPSDSAMNPDKEIPVINYWLDNCQKNHAACASSEPNFMPSRVIDVGHAEDKEVRLVSTVELDFTDRPRDAAARRYLALSHCWGLTMPPTATTTSSTIADRLQAIPMAGLSRTFTDFISIARRMYVPYVWIDSLCIIQDAKEDWEKEASQMAAVYSNSYCTIAASSSVDGNGGCHVDPNSEPYGPVTLSIKETDEDGYSTVQKVRVFSLSATPITSILQQDPLSSRGWTFQERELSNRILHYSKDSIRWECRDLKASLQFPWQDTNAFNGNLRTFDVGQIGPQNADQQLNAEQKDKDEKAWFEAVLNYTGRTLTKQSDVLHAFSGIARTVESRTSDRYLAGLWYSNLIHCLCWNSNWHPSGKKPVFDINNPESITHARRPGYLAPSWSWASIIGQVRYEWWIFHALDPCLTPKAASLMPKILEATTISAGLDKYGSLKGGRIRLVGKMKPALTRGEGFARQDREGVYDLHKGKMREVGMIKYDVPSEAPAGKIKAIICLCVLPRAEKHRDAVGLALLPTAIKNEYCRVGLVFGIQWSWYETCVDWEITIV